MSGLFNGSEYTVRRSINYLLEAGEKLFGSKDPDEGKKINYAEAREIITDAAKRGAVKFTIQPQLTISHHSKTPKPCKHCGKSFSNRDSKFCSKQCAWAGKEAKGAIKKICIRCGTKFATFTERALYCSTPCKQSAYTEAKREKRIRKLPLAIVCKCCQKKVKPRSPRQKFCTTACNDKYYRDKWNARVSMEKKAQRSVATQSHD